MIVRTKLVFLLAIAFFITDAWSASFVVKNIKIEKNLVIAGGLSAGEGSKLTVMISGQECIAQVNRVKGENALLQFDFNCRLNGVEKGQTLAYEMDKDSTKTLEVSKVDSKKHLLFTNVPHDMAVKIGSEFTLFSSDRNHCVIPVVSVTGIVAGLNTRKCSFEYEIREGLKLEPRGGITKVSRGKGAATLDSMYFLFGAGYPKISYSSAHDKETVDALKNDSSVSNFAFALDLVGVYFPLSSGLILCGGVVHAVRDGYSGEGIKFEVYQIQAGPSILWFFNRQTFAKGVFLRGDVGYARYTATAVTSAEKGGVENPPAQTGFGAMAGGGMAFNVSDYFSLLAQGLYAYRSMGTSKISTVTFMLDLLF